MQLGESNTSYAQPVTFDEIRQFVQANINNPAAIAKRMGETGVTLADLAEATSYSPADIMAYFQQAGVHPPGPTTTTATERVENLPGFTPTASPGDQTATGQPTWQGAAQQYRTGRVNESGIEEYSSEPTAGQEYTFVGQDGQTYFVSGDRSTNDPAQVASWKARLGFDPSQYMARGPNGEMGIRQDIANQIGEASPANQGGIDPALAFLMAPLLAGGMAFGPGLLGMEGAAAGGAMDVGLGSVLPAEWVQDAAAFGGIEGAAGAAPWGAGAEFVIPQEFYPPGSFPEGGMFPAIPPGINLPNLPPTPPSTGGPAQLPPITPEYANQAIGPNTTGVDAYGNPLTPLPDLSGQVNPNLPGTPVNPLPPGAEQPPAPVQEGPTTPGPGPGGSQLPIIPGPGTGGLTGIDWLDALMRGLPGVIGAYGANKQSGALEDLAKRYEGYGAPSRARFESSFAPGFTMGNDPGFTDSLNMASKANLYGLSSKGNPAGNPTAQAANMEDLFKKTAYPALQNYRGTNAAAGGFGTYAAAAPGAATNAIGAQGNAMAALGGATGDVFNPKQDWSQLLRQLLRP